MRPGRWVLGLALSLVGAAPALGQSTEVIMTPAGGTVTGGQVTVTVLWCGYGTAQSNFDIGTVVITANSVDVTGNFDLQPVDPSLCGFSGPVSEEQFWRSTGTVTVNATTGPVTVLADVSNAWNFHWSAMETYSPVTFGVSVTPDGASEPSRPENTSGYSASFTIQNTGSTQNTFSFSCSPSGGVTCGTVPTPVLLPGNGGQTMVAMPYSVGGAGTGTLTLTATGTNATDNGWYSVPITPAGPGPTYGVDVQPNGATSQSRLPNSGPHSESFSVTNTGSTQVEFSFACSGAGGVTCGQLPGPVTLAANGGNTQVAMPYSVGAAGTGTLTLTASGTNSNDNGWYSVPVAPPPPPTGTTEVIMTPAGGTITGGQVTVTVRWCGFGTGQSNFNIESRVITANSVNVTGNFDLQAADPSLCGFSGPVSEEQFFTSTGTVTVNATTGPVTVFADVSNAWNFHWSAMESYSPAPTPYGVSVTPDGATSQSRLANSGPHSENFTVKNTGSTSNTFNFQCSEAGGVTCGQFPGPVTLAGSDSTVVSMPYSVGAAGFGTLTLIATGTSATDDGSYTVPILPGPTYGVEVLPKGATSVSRPAGTQNHTETFTVKNTGNGENFFTLGCNGANGVTCSQPPSLSLGPQATETVNVTYNVGAVGTGTLSLLANGTNGSVSDSGWYSVPIIPAEPQPPPTGFTNVSIVPAGYFVVGPTQVTVTIRWCAYPPDFPVIDNRVITVNGVNVTSSFDLQEGQTVACGFEGEVSDHYFWTSTGTITVDQSTGPVTVLAEVFNASGFLWMATETYTPAGPRRGVIVTAEQQFPTAPSGPSQAIFTIRNTGNAPDTYSFALNPACSAPVTSCQLPAPVNVAAGGTATATVNYTLLNSPGATGLMWLRAASTSDAATKDSSWTQVTVQAAPLGVSIVGTAPGLNDNAWRSACITVALTDAAASECGDLRLVHTLPSVRTMGTVRTPVLLYNSQHARPKPLVMADVRLLASVALPESLTACIKVLGVNRGCVTWAGSTWGAPGNTRRIVVAGDDGPWNTGRVDYTLRVTPSDSNQNPYSATGRLFIVNRSASTFGAGWWLSGLEQLVVVSSTELLWIGGDGSARRFAKQGNVWKAPNFAARDSIRKVGNSYVRYTAEHARVYFDATGRHESTVNSLGHVTRFEYTGALLTKIQVPKPGGAWVDYTLSYAGGLLDSVTAPLRGTKLFRTGARVDSIRDPDGNKVRFTSGSGLNQYVVTARKDRRENSTTFSYDPVSNRLTQAARPLGNTTVLGVAEIKGLAAPVPLDSAFTEVDGPRTDVSDRTRFWINGYGAPVRVRNAAGYETRIRYDAGWPGLADSVVDANRLGTRAFYHPTRGLPDSTRDYRPLGTTSNALTRYRWHPSLNRLTSARVRHSGSTDGILDSIRYKSDSTVDWTQRGTNQSRRVNYTYTADRLPWTVTLPNLPVSDVITFSYDALGNLSQETSPSGFVTLFYGDAAGRDTLVVTPRGTGTDATNPAQVLLKGVRQRTVFDQMSRDTLAVTVGPQVTLPNGRVVPADTIRLRSTYDAEGNRLSATRGYTRKLDATQGGIFEMSPSLWEFDALNRVFKQSDAGSGSTILTLDPAGNATQTLTPRGHTIRAEYDALNRVTRRIVPQVIYGNSGCNYPLQVGSCQYTMPILEGPTLCIAVDTARFSYDAGGNLRRAENNWAKVRRGYFPNGQVKHDTLIIRSYETQASGPCGGGDKHALADAPGDWFHTYVLQYGYDLAGRRTSLAHPAALNPCSGACVQTYNYETSQLVGTLSSLVHPSSSGSTLTTQFGYDNQLRHLTTTHPGSGVITSRTYDSDGRVITRTGPATSDNLSHDATGRVIGGSVYVATTGTTQTLSLGYGGLGALQWSEGVAVGVTNEEFKTDALGNRLWVKDNQVVDNVDRTKYFAIAPESGQLNGIELGTGPCVGPGPQPSCHPAWYRYEHFQSHDAAGNVEATWGKDTRNISGDPEQVPEETRSYYSADQQLTYYNRHLGWSTPGEGTGTFDEYRYDALGRRVFSRSRRPASCQFPCEAYVQRTVWDGDQVLYEVRSSGKTGVDPQYMEADMEGGVAPGDDPNLYGIVAYAHAHGIDQPVGMLKKIPGGSWAYVTPHANWRGDWSYGTFSNGDLCLTTGAACPTWPGFYSTADGSSQGTAPPTYTVWWGSLIRDRADASGLQYLRNRYYDPKTGRFTQQDPIGLAGGMNLYGFGNGDPINFSDPFGLNPCLRGLAACAQAFTQGLTTVGRGAAAAGRGIARGFQAIRGMLSRSGSGEVDAAAIGRSIGGAVRAQATGKMSGIAQRVTEVGLEQANAVAATQAAVEALGLRSFVQAVGQNTVVSSVQPGRSIPVLVVQAGGRVVQGTADLVLEGTKAILSNVRF